MGHILNPECVTCLSLLEFTFQNKATCGCTAGWNAYKEGKCQFKNMRVVDGQDTPTLFSHEAVLV